MIMQDNTVSQNLSALIAYTRHKIEKFESQYPVDKEIDVRPWMEQPDPDFIGIAELSVRFGLTVEDVEILAFLAGLSLTPNVFENAVLPIQIQSLCRILSCRQNDSYAHYLSRFEHHQPLCRHGLISMDAAYDMQTGLDLSLSLRRVVLPDCILRFLQHPDDSDVQMSESLSLFAQRIDKTESLENLRSSSAVQNTILQMVRAQNSPALIVGPENADKVGLASAIAGLCNLHLISVDLPGLLSLPAEGFYRRMTELLRTSALCNGCIFLDAARIQDQISGQHERILSQFLREHFILIGLSRLPSWMVEIACNWPQIEVAPPDAAHRMDLWKEAFKNDKRAPDETSLQSIAGRYELSAPQIHAAALSARQFSLQSRRKRIDISDLEKASQSFAPMTGDSLAQRMMIPAISLDDLFLPESERSKFDELLTYASAHDTIFSEWGFGAHFPKGRGLCALFYGEPGTGKTMAASILAQQLKRSLYRIDCAKISSFDGEKNDQITRIFNLYAHEQQILLFEHTELLFSQPGQIHILSHLSDFEGIAIFKTSHEESIEDTFKRQMRYRIEFPMPDARIRTKIYQAALPKSAPIKKEIPFQLLGEYFELSGSQIRQVVLNAAFYAYRDHSDIGLAQLTESAVAVCREQGMLVNDNLPMPLTNAIRIEKGMKPLSEEEYRRIHKPVISQDLPLLDIPEGIPIGHSGDFDYR